MFNNSEMDDYDIVHSPDNMNKLYIMYVIQGNLEDKSSSILIIGYSRIIGLFFKITIEKNKNLHGNISDNNYFIEDDKHNLYCVKRNYVNRDDLDSIVLNEVSFDYKNYKIPYVVYSLMVGSIVTII